MTTVNCPRMVIKTLYLCHRFIANLVVEVEYIIVNWVIVCHICDLYWKSRFYHFLMISVFIRYQK